MAEYLREDLVVREGETRTFPVTMSNAITAALIVGDYEGNVGQTYYEPWIINRGEIRLTDSFQTQATLFHINSTLSWRAASIENYGLISVIVPQSPSARAIWAIADGPDLYNAGTIEVSARGSAIGYSEYGGDLKLVNAATGIVRTTSEEYSIGFQLAYGAKIENRGEILSHVTGGGHSLVPDVAIGMRFGVGGGAFFAFSLVNSGLIKASTTVPAQGWTAGLYLHGDSTGTIVNSGTIRGEYAVWEVSESSVVGGMRIENSGLIDGRIILNHGADTILNTGRIVGTVDLGFDDDVYDGATGSVTGSTSGGEGSDRLTGGVQTEHFLGGAGDDILKGGGGADMLEGGSGADLFLFGAASDSSASAMDHILDFQSGLDKIDLRGLAILSIDWTASGGVQLVTVKTKEGDLVFHLTGALAETDFLYTLTPSPMFGTSGIDQLIGGDGPDEIYGQEGDDLLYGQGGNDLILGGLGNDRMEGGQGNDTFYVDAAGDIVIENFGQGSDRISTSVSYFLPATSEVELIEATTLSANAAMNLGGSDTANTILGNNGANTLYGNGGNDTLHAFEGDDYLVGGTGLDNLYGGKGDDRYYVGFADGDRIWEFAGEGYDTVATDVDYELPDVAHVERLEAGTLSATSAIALSGSNFDNLIIGNAGNNRLRGLAGNDTLQGLGGDDYLIGDEGADVMYGGTGNDTYYVNTSDDRIFENAGEGTNDRVATEVSFTLPEEAEVEVLEAVNFDGNSVGTLGGSRYDNIITGDAGNNVLRGYGGNDTLRGHLGNDTLIGDDGNDTMIGGQGNDTYYVDAAGDVVVEEVGQGTDRVSTSVSYALSPTTEIETLEASSLGSADPINLTGSNSANTIIGNNGANVIDGKGGNDVLVGAGGADTFAFTTAFGAGNIDRIEDFQVGVDKIGLEDTIFAAIAPGALAAGAFFAGTQAADGDDRIIYNQATGALYYDPDGIGAAAQVQFATLSGGPLLTSADFVLI